MGRDLLAWYDANKRDLPWRGTDDPYAVWVSEVMLQQTQVATVLPYYERWMARFPTLESLSEAEVDRALEVWQGLGYYRRCRHMLEAARLLATRGIPNDRDGWLKVPGVGRYTASAIASICFGEAVGVADGNVQRVFARMAGCPDSGAELAQKAQDWADHHVDPKRPGDWNQAVMELGATVCKPKAPECGRCPLEPECVARQTWAVERYPARRHKPRSVAVFRSAWAPFLDGRFGLRRTPEGQWSAGLWEFPYLDLADGESPNLEALQNACAAASLESLGDFKHSVTHHRIRVEAWLARVEAKSGELEWFTPKDCAALPMASAQRRILKRACRLLGIEIDRG
ncbi:MAG: A/G-specific adenine glycosylase [Armatimonadetes bacterium]|nr:A/G-specific adenine glycosylase [Armatimonadota bacterium]